MLGLYHFIELCINQSTISTSNINNSKGKHKNSEFGIESIFTVFKDNKILTKETNEGTISWIFFLSISIIIRFAPFVGFKLWNSIKLISR